jgi:histidinol-phosphate/aromatic aminotransferase/cobyric acid decarboxylase-like protein
MTTLLSDRLVVTEAGEGSRAEIFRVRHEVYASELGQHAENEEGELRDGLDGRNVYLVVERRGELAGFVSVTPPSAGMYSVDKYFRRGELPFEVDGSTWEIRLLTVKRGERGSEVAWLLMLAAFRWVESRGGRRVMAIGRKEVLGMYEKAAMRRCGMEVAAGEVKYELMTAEVGEIRAVVDGMEQAVRRFEEGCEWRLDVPMRRPAGCFHGGAFFEAVGPRFDDLGRAAGIINADVLDAWYPPAPAVLESLQQHLPWLLRTSPPTGCEGLLEAIAAARGLPEGSVLAGAGSSDLIFRAFRTWLRKGSRVLILDPTYGEYAHVLERVIGCEVVRMQLGRENNWEVDPVALQAALADDLELAVIVNPNSPTGRLLPAEVLREILAGVPGRTRVWVDETYTDFCGPNQTVERDAVASANVVVCKSMSKAYALSGARVAYLAAGPHQLEALRAVTPPWAVSLPAQVAAVRALESTDYYTARWAETGRLREGLAASLRRLGWRVLPGSANFLLCELPVSGPTAAEVVRGSRLRGLFLRDAGAMGSAMGNRMLRVAVKSGPENAAMAGILGEVLEEADAPMLV